MSIHSKFLSSAVRGGRYCRDYHDLIIVAEVAALQSCREWPIRVGRRSPHARRRGLTPCEEECFLPPYGELPPLPDAHMLLSSENGVRWYWGRRPSCLGQRW